MLEKAKQLFRRDDRAQNPIKNLAIGFILIAIAMVIALTVLPIVTSQVNTAQNDSNISEADGTLLGLLPTLLIVGLLGGGVSFLVRSFNQIKGRGGM